MKINTIVFDMGGVLLDFGAELFSRRLHVGAEGEALLRQHLLCTTDWVRLDRRHHHRGGGLCPRCARAPAGAARRGGVHHLPLERADRAHHGHGGRGA